MVSFVAMTHLILPWSAFLTLLAKLAKSLCPYLHLIFHMLDRLTLYNAKIWSNSIYWRGI